LVGKAVGTMTEQRRVEERQNRSVTPLPRRSKGVATGRPSPVAPAWPALIAIVLAGTGLFALTDGVSPAGAWRAIIDSLMVALMFGAVAGWVRANLPALAQIDERGSERFPLEIRYVSSEPHPPWRAEAKGRRRERVRRTGVRQVSPEPGRR
jgi:hypothetical protein